ncbi:3799_t:CDS:2, partial [Gigaspora margarita]
MEKLQDLSPQNTQAAEGGETGSNITVSTSTDWMELMEHEKVEENLYSSKSDASLLNSSEEENLQASLPESSSNFDGKRSDDPSSADLHMGIRLNSSKGNSNPYQKNKTWSSLFTKLTKGKATYSSFSLRSNINTKNNNALIFDIQKLSNISTNDIISTLYSKIGADFIGAKPHFVRGARSYIEIIFADSKHMKKYAKEGIVIFQQTLYGFISTRSNKEILTVKLKRVPIAARDKISEEIKEAFGNIGTILAIKPLLYEGTPIQSDQWMVVFDVTNDEDLVQRIPRYVNIMEQKKAARELKQQYKEYKEIKKNHAMVSNPTSVIQQSQEDEQEALQETTGSDLNNLEMTVVDQDTEMVLQKQRIIDDARQTEELATVQLEENKDEEVVDINVRPVRFENSLREITSVEEIQPCSVDVSVLEGNSSQFPSKVNHKEDSFIQKVRNGGTMLTRLDYVFLDDEHMQLCKKVDTLFGSSNHALNPKTVQEISQELKENSDDTDWDFSKIKIQSIVQAFKLPPVSEKRIKKINKRINELKRNAGDWPWDLQSLNAIEKKGDEITVAKAMEFLKQSSMSHTFSQANLFSERDKKKNGPRLSHLVLDISRDCPWCPNMEQTMEHF